MKLHRSHWALAAAFALLGTVAAAPAQAQFLFYSPMGPFIRSGMVAPTYSYSYSNPYVAPYPAYGVIPGPILLAPWQYTNNQIYTNNTAAYTLDQLAAPARKRVSLYPAVPFENAPGIRFEDIRRVRFEIQVPRENAVVLVDGVETKQTGLNRMYMTPPMVEDRLYTSEFEARWTDDQGKAHSARKTFEFVAGETLRHTFK